MADRQGSEFHADCVAAGDASAGKVFAIYYGGMTVAHTLRANQKLCITDVDVITKVKGTSVTGVYCNTQASGQRVVEGFFDANSGLSKRFGTPHICPAGVVPKLFAPDDAVSVSAILHGFIIES